MTRPEIEPRSRELLANTRLMVWLYIYIYAHTHTYIYIYIYIYIYKYIYIMDANSNTGEITEYHFHPILHTPSLFIFTPRMNYSINSNNLI